MTRSEGTVMLLAVLVLTGLALISQENYLLFHSMIEIAAVVVAFSIFIIIWNARRIVPDTFFLITGISLLFIGILDLLHMLAYAGMGVFPGSGSNLPTQLWIAARYFQSIAFLCATFCIGRTLTKDRQYDIPLILAACLAASGLLLMSIFAWKIFPACYIEGVGLTPFKIASEYVIALFLIITMVILYRKRDHFETKVWHLLLAAQGFLVLGELAFTSYVSVYGFVNLLGHLFRLLSVYCFYRVFVAISLTEPYNLLLVKVRQEEHERNERFKELSCLFVINNLLDEPVSELQEMLEQTVRALPPGMQYPEITRARLVLEGRTYETPGFQVTQWMITREIRARGTPIGRLDVCYLEDRPAPEGTPFFDEEQRMIKSIADRLGMAIERQRAETALRESERRYRSFVQSFRGIAYLSTADWIPVFFHGAVEEMTGYREEDFIAGNPRWDQVILPEDLAEIAQRDNPNLLHVPGYSTQRVYRITRKNGQVRWVSDFIQNWTDEQGTMYLSGVLADITGKKQIEEALRESEEKYRTLIETANESIIIAQDELIVYCNARMCRLVGRTPEELSGMPIVKIIWPDDREMISTRYRQRISGMDVPDSYDFRVIGPEGEMRWVVISAVLITWQGRPATLNLLTDITARRKTEEALIAANRKLNLLSGITRHDIKNQLMALTGFLDLSKRSLNDPAAMAEFVAKEEKIAGAISRQISFTKDYEDLGVKSAVWQDVSLLVRTAGAALPLRQVKLACTCTGLWVFADPLLEKVFYNLIDNTLRYAGADLTSVCMSAAEEPDGLRIVYEDDGAGIGQEDKKKLFTKGFGKHTGLGLFLSREILSITGMSITETGEPGRGARFEIFVPKGAYRFGTAV